MNYYIQGNAAKAQQIKAAFEKLGIDVLDFGFADKTVVYCSMGGACVQSLPYSINLMHILHSHSDYKELELPVEPKFKVGDWIACNADSFTLSIKSVRDENYYFHQGASLPIKDIDEHYHLWTIADAKDGDVLVDEDTNTIGIFEKIYGIRWHSKIYCAKSTCTMVYDYRGSHKIKFTKPATKEQRDLLFQKIKEAGYEWDAEKKELRKIQPHYDITNFQPFDKVLVRSGNDEEWMIEFYCKYDTLVHTSPHRDYPFMGIGYSYSQCIPYEGNEHLLGTTDMCDEQYINW